jgi:ELWxxDGT repeat protein/VCBS repeat-containing protein
MRTPSWLRPLADRLTLPRTRRVPPRPAFRPRVEGLEDRSCPSVTSVTDIASARLTPVGSKLYFVGDDPVNGHRVWRTDGQLGGTTLVNSGGRPVMDNFTADGFDRQQPVLLAAGHYVYFFTVDGGDRFTLWRNDSENETGLSQELHTFADLDQYHTLPYGLTACGQDVYFVANVTATDTPDPDDTEGWGYELWKTNGVTGATAPFKDILSGPDGSYPSLAAAGPTLYYAAGNGPDTNVLWGVTNPTSGAAARISDGTTGLGYLSVGPDLYLLGVTGDEGYPNEIWRVTSPTAAAQHITDLQSGANGVINAGYVFTGAGSAFYFVDETDASYRLWRCEGSTVTLLKSGLFGTNSLGFPKDIRYELTNLAVIGSDVYYTGYSFSGGSNIFDGVWKYDGSTGNISTIANFGPLDDPALICTAGSTLFYSDGSGGTVWQTNGTVSIPVPNFPSGVSIQGSFGLGAQGVFSALVGSTTYFSAGGLWRVNNPPVAGADAYTADQDTALTLGAAGSVLANDTDADHDPLTASIVTGPTHGSLTLNADGSFTYTPVAGYVGPDSFTYRASDGFDPSNVATVSLTVRPVVRGTADADTIAISRVGGQIQAVVNGTTLPLFSADGQLFVYGGDGLDTITLDAAPSGGILLDGQDGDDSYTVTFGDLAGPVAVSDTGATGSDTLTINGTSAPDILTKGAGFVKWQPAPAAAYQEVDFAGMEGQVVLNAGAGNDTIHDPDSGNFLILGGDGDDTIIIQDTIGAVTADGGNGSDTYIAYGGTLQGAVTINDSGTTGTNSVTVVGTTGADTITESGSQVTVNNSAAITIGSGVTSLTVDSGGGSGDTFTATGTPTVTPTVTGVSSAVVSGTAGDDKIQIKQGGPSGRVTVWVNGALVGTYSPTGRLVVHGLAGNDDIQADGNVAIPLWLYGDGGNDRLKGGSGNNVLLGGDGDDLLVGGSNRDILIGGRGADRLVGNAEDDILIAGYTLFDADAAALGAILEVWSDPTLSYQQRVGALTTTGVGADQAVKLDASTVSDDGAQDVLTGTSGQDWFLANVSGGGVSDKLTDLSAAEFATDLAFINGL